VFINELRVKDDHRLGDVNNGWNVALTTLMNERSAIGANNHSDSDMFEKLIAMVRHFGLDKDPLIRNELASIVMHYRVAGLNSARALARLRAGQMPGPEMSTAKMALTMNQARVVNFLTHVLGPKLQADTGEWGTYAWSTMVLNAPGLRIAGGTDEVMRNIVGERVLGLPKEPGIDSNSPFRDLKVGTQK
jgi:acyl-CoA dehydrogenase